MTDIVYERSRSHSSESYHAANYLEEDGEPFIETNDYAKMGFKRALKDVARLAVPISVTSILASLLLFCNLVWIGHHVTSTQFAGTSLGILIVNVAGNAVCIGMTSGLDTQCGQAWGGNVHYMVGVFTQRSIIISHIVMAGIAIIFIFGGDILLLLQQNKRASYYAGFYIWIYIAGIWPVSMFQNLRRFLQAQRKVKFIPVSVLIGLITQICMLLLLVNWGQLGFFGAAPCLSFSYYVMFGSLLFFTVKHKLHEECWKGWNCKEAMKDWKSFLDLSIPGTLMLCAELWAFQLLSLVAGTFSKNYLSAFTICLNTFQIFLRIPIGISMACAVLVSNKLGSKLPDSARIAWNASLVISMSSSFVCACAMFFGANGIAHLYTNDSEVIRYVKQTLPYTAVYFFIDSYQRCSAGAVRGLGRQLFGSVTYLFSYYGVGMPMGIWFAVDGFMGTGGKMHLKGLWIGAGISVTVCSMFFFGLRLWINWDKEVERAQQRLEKERQALEEFKRKARERMERKNTNSIIGNNNEILTNDLLNEHNDIRNSPMFMDSPNESMITTKSFAGAKVNSPENNGNNESQYENIFKESTNSYYLDNVSD